MCGIFGYVGSREIIPILISGLKKLEYRGYDSAGLCVLSHNKLSVVKKTGNIAELEKDAQLDMLKGTAGIAHTRWATHGMPSTLNAHPHLDCSNTIAIVHNGIIENYHPLKALLEREGHRIISETDSEVIAHLIEKFNNGDIEEAVIKALALLEGAFGLAIMHSGQEKIIAARRGSPLIIGLGKKEQFVASDVPALLQQTKKVTYLRDNEIAVLTKDNCSIRSFSGRRVEKKIHRIKWTINRIEKDGFEHFMLKEIFEQPEAVKNTLSGRIKNNRIRLSVKIKTNSIKRILITACGTSWHSALIGKYLIEEIARVPTEVDYASEFRYRNPILNPTDLVIAISQSGETADTLAAIREAQQKNARTLGIVNAVGSSITREVDSGIYLHAGPEMGVASTKAFSCQVTALLLFALYLRQSRKEKLNKEFLRELAALPEKIDAFLKGAQRIRALAEKFKDSPNFIYLGRGINFPVALEGALKLKEVSYIHAEGYPAAEMKHGPIALIDKKMPVVFLATKDKFSAKILNNMQEVKARQGKIIAITNGGDEKINRLADHVIEVPHTLNELSPVINVIPLQLLAYYIAQLKGLNMDRPRNLAKSVTVE